MLLDLPLGGNRGKIDTGSIDAIIEDPDGALAGHCILPNKVCLERAEEICCARNVPLSRDGGKIDTGG